MKPLDAVGLIINPQAGQGFAANAHTARAVVAALRPGRVFTAPRELGAAALLEGGEKGADLDLGAIAVTVVPVSAPLGRAQTQAAALALAAMPLSALIVIGGDGTLADAACSLIGRKNAPALLGVGVGSTNAGSLITCRADNLQQLDPARLEVCQLNALLVYADDRVLGVGFNDCILGFTVVGTLDGKVMDVDAAAKMIGQTIPGTVRAVGTRLTVVERTAPDGAIRIASGSHIATVAIGFAERSFFAKAITGGVCLASLVGAPAGCLVADQPLVRIGIDRSEVLAMPPVNSSYLTFEENQRIRVCGVRSGTAVCVDGNPIRLLSPRDTAEFGVALNAVRSVRSV